MPPTALQLPALEGKTASAGPRLFRKQVLPLGSITYQGRTLNFTREYLRRLADHFKAGAVDQVPFVLADAENKHNDHPENYRGETKGFELTDSGLDAIIEMTEDGAKLIRDNPRLGISPRIIEQAFEWGPRKVPAIAHLCGTLVPRNGGMGPWTPLNSDVIAEFGAAYSAGHIVDLTAATYEMPGTDANIKLTDEQKDKLKALGVPEDKYEDAAKIFAEEPDPSATDGKGDGDDTSDTDDDERGAVRKFLSKVLGREITDSEVTEIEREKDRLLEGTEAKVTTGSEGKDKTPATADLSADAKQTIDLANSQAASANARVGKLEKELANARREELIGKGIPPAIVDLCLPAIMSDDAKVIELSGGEKFDANEFATKVLEEYEGHLDLSGELGRDVVLSGDDEAKQKAAEWHKASEGAKA